MKNCLIVYYSLGGTTKKIADKIAIGLESTGYNVDIHDITKSLPPSLEKYDLLGIGTPAYYFRPPFNITDYLKSLPKLNIPYFTFILYGSIIGDAGNRIRKRLNKKGAKDVGFFKCNGSENFYGYIKRGVITYPSHPDAEDLENAENFGRCIKSNIDNEIYKPEDFDKKPGIIYRIERFATKKWMVKKLYYRFFKINKSKCTKCGICVNSCPTSNITMENTEFPSFGKECIACFNCELSCPEEAISSVLDWMVFKPFMNYNVRHLPKISDIELVKVKLTRGKIEKIE
ncbi:MAG: EFR1 family ferrodoxin [Promethearchaeota archaeon]